MKERKQPIVRKEREGKMRQMKKISEKWKGIKRKQKKKKTMKRK